MPIEKVKNTTAKKSRTKKSAASFSIASTASPRTFDEILRDKTARTRIRRNITQELLKIKRASSLAKSHAPAYSYIYADYLKTGKYEKMMRAIENRLTDLGISGKIHRLSQFKNLKEIIEEDARRGTAAVVVVGDDLMVEEAIRALAGSEVALGIIPMGGGEDKIAELLGIPQGAAACDVLSQRLIDYLDLGKINGKIFISRLSIFGQRIPILCDNKYEIFSPGGDVIIYNINLDLRDKTAPGTNPKDGRLEVFVRPKKRFGMFGLDKRQGATESLFFAKELKMKSGSPVSVYVDGKKCFYKDVFVEIAPKALKAIVGKNRMI